jgi:hypothetical protein
MGLYAPGDAPSGSLISLLRFLAGQDARNSTLSTRYPMYKGVKEQPRTGQKNNLDGRHITCTVTYTCSITQRKSYINLHTSGDTGPSPMLRSGPQIMCITVTRGERATPVMRHHVLRTSINRIFPYGVGKL